MKFLPLIAVATLSVSGCANFSQNVQQVLGTPAQVQSDISYLGGRAKPYIGTEAQAKIHTFAVALNSAANLDLTALYAYLPATTGSITGDLLVATAKSTLSLIVSRWGTNNGTALEYAHALGNGLLTNF